jgi:hypothetical protein
MEATFVGPRALCTAGTCNILIEAYRLENSHWMLLVTHAGDVAARIEPFEAVELELWRFWGRSEPR